MDLGSGAEVKIKIFQNMVMLHIKFKLTMLAATWKQIFCQQTHPRPRGWGQKVNLFIFLKVVMLHIKLKLTNWQQHGSKYFAHRHTLDPRGGVKRSNYIFY